MKRKPNGRLELTWKGKESALIPVNDGAYDYAWVDPDDPRAREVKSIEVTERVGELDGPTGAGENLLIVGESGDALRSLGTIPEYAERFLGQVKLVYIDPPFNTGQTFEHYADQMEHSIWLTMMRDRIRDIKPLMASDASIWVHLDDAEVHRMRLLLDEEFGAGNFVATVIWEKTDLPQMQSENFSTNHDYILVYQHSEQFVAHKIPSKDIPSHYNKTDADGRRYFTRTLRQTGPGSARSDRETMWYPIVAPDGTEVWPIRDDGSEGRWRWGRERLEAEFDQIDWQRPHGQKWDPHTRTYWLGETRRPSMTIWPYRETGSNRTAKNELRALFAKGTALFDTPKPERLLERVISIGSNRGDLVLDCFAGSGTTAAVAHKLGRRWVTIELQDSTARTFILPRLTKVVNGDDPGGITVKVERVAVDALPEGVTPEDAQRFTSLLAKFAEGVNAPVEVVKALAERVRADAKSTPATLSESEARTLLSLLRNLERESATTVTVDASADVVKALRRVGRTRNETTTIWRGGGGFTVAQMGPSMYDVDDEDGVVYLSEHATNGAWSKAVAGQLKFTLTPDNPIFCGVRRRQRLAVIDGVVDETIIRTIVESLGEGETAIVVGKAVIPPAGALLAELSPGSRIRKAPDDLFPKVTVT
ncbi:MAG: site-specific DNA-methyltransferase [Actinobacteria bacterium]|nr:site-specific DNA-methyltransferase [Actinomycetota bacterium]